MTVRFDKTSLVLREATTKEVSEAKGSYLWQLGASPWTLACKVMGTTSMLLAGANVLNWKKPCLQDLADRISYYSGNQPEYTFIESIYSFRGDRHFLLGDINVFKAVLGFHRNDGLFEPSDGFLVAFNLMQEIFSVKLTKEDFMFTCSPIMTACYRKTLSQGLKNINRSNIQNRVEKTLQDWEEQSSQGFSINASMGTKLYASGVILDILFNAQGLDREVAEGVDFFNEYIIKCVLGASKEDKAKFESLKTSFPKAVDKILAGQFDLFKEPIIIDGQEYHLSEIQQKVLIFFIFFAGQETTASLLSYIIHKLAMDSAAQDLFYEELKKFENDESLTKKGKLREQTNVINNLFAHSIKAFTPAYGIARKAAKDIAFEWSFEGEKTIHKRIFFKGEYLVPKIKTLAESEKNEEKFSQWLPFGHGTHHCPGEQLAVIEICEFLLQLLKKYKISTETTEEIKQVGRVTLQLEKPVIITLERREIDE